MSVDWNRYCPLALPKHIYIPIVYFIAFPIFTSIYIMQLHIPSKLHHINFIGLLFFASTVATLETSPDTNGIAAANSGAPAVEPLSLLHFEQTTEGPQDQLGLDGVNVLVNSPVGVKKGYTCYDCDTEPITVKTTETETRRKTKTVKPTEDRTKTTTVTSTTVEKATKTVTSKKTTSTTIPTLKKATVTTTSTAVATSTTLSTVVQTTTKPKAYDYTITIVANCGAKPVKVLTIRKLFSRKCITLNLPSDYKITDLAIDPIDQNVQYELKLFGDMHCDTLAYAPLLNSGDFFASGYLSAYSYILKRVYT